MNFRNNTRHNCCNSHYICYHNDYFWNNGKENYNEEENYDYGYTTNYPSFEDDVEMNDFNNNRNQYMNNNFYQKDSFRNDCYKHNNNYNYNNCKDDDYNDRENNRCRRKYICISLFRNSHRH